VPLHLIAIAFVAFVCEWIDATLGMGYGTSLTPVLLLMGFEPLQIVPCVLLSEFVTGFAASFCHHRAGNADFRLASRDSNVALALGLFSVVGVIGSIFVAVHVPKEVLKLLIAVIVFSMGGVILLAPRLKSELSWRRIGILGTIASLNKGLSGGGYGPLVTGGQMLSGVKIKSAVAITSLAEGITCITGVALYVGFVKQVDWTLAPWLLAGALLSTPFASLSLRKMPERGIKVGVGFFLLLLGGVTLSRLLF
jgi:hypothetical protein